MHSLAYFYNWCFAQVADPLLLEVGRRHGAHHRGRGLDRPTSAGRSATSSRSSGCRGTGSTSRATSNGYLDLGLRNAEEWGFPIGPDFVFTKAYEWEIRTTPDPVRSIGLPHGLCVELKYLDGDEFAHWTDPASFATCYRNKRKRREWTVFNALQRGRGAAGRARDHAPRTACTSSTTSPRTGCRARRARSRWGCPSWPRLPAQVALASTQNSL